MNASGKIAIVGMGLRFPGSAGPGDFWRNLENGTDSSRVVPEGRWPMPLSEVIDAAHPASIDRIPVARGYFVDQADLVTTGLDIDPATLNQLDPLFHLVLAAGRDAFFDCTSHRTLNRQRVAVTIGNIALPTSHSSRLAQEILGATFAEQMLGRPAPAPLTPAADYFVAGLPAGILAKALGLGAGSFTLDAACASSLYAIKLAADALRDGNVDAVITGGVSRADSLYTQMGFAQLRALSLAGIAYPFDARAGGLVVGEGAGFFVLKRLEDAVRQGDNIYGVIAGCGLSNDLAGGLLAPSSEGQLRSMRAAYAESGWSPQDVDMIECHATGTPLGDRVEVTSLKELWQGSKPDAGCVIGSVKANVGHLLTAAGASSLAKVLLALQNRTLPPTANYSSSSDKLGLAGSPFRVLSQATPWERRSDSTPRRAAISGFGFGGINAHLLVEEWLPENARSQTLSSLRPQTLATPPTPRRVAIIGRAEMTAERSETQHSSTWWGAEDSKWYRSLFGAEPPQKTSSIESLKLPYSAFRIPPVELKEMLPQQLLMLSVAAQALANAGIARDPKPTAGVFIGIALDGATNFYSCRWGLESAARLWNEQLNLKLSAAELADWTANLKASFGHELTANRTMGSLGGVVASRIAREFGFGAAGFTVSNEECSGLRALAIGAAAIRRGECDVALVGAVDFAAQLMSATAIARWRREHGEAAPRTLADGAAALILKDYDSAVAAGDRIYGIIRQDSRGDLKTIEPDASTREPYFGAASGLMGVMRALKALETRIVPATQNAPAQYWIRNRVEGPRIAVAASQSVDGTSLQTMIEEAPAPSLCHSGSGHERFGLFLIRGDSEHQLGESLHELKALAANHDRMGPAALAAVWQNSASTSGHLKLALLADQSRSQSLAGQIDLALSALSSKEDAPAELKAAGIYFVKSSRPPAPLAFMFPGAGSYYSGMGRELAAAFPAVLEIQEQKIDALKSQFGSEHFWLDRPPSQISQPSILAAQCSLACLVTDILARCGITPSAAIGYSLGESAALLALGAWSNRNEVHARLLASDIFSSQLAGDMLAVKRHWGLSPSATVTWANFLVKRSEANVRKAIQGLSRVYLNNVNTDTECVIGGDRTELIEVLKRLDHPPIEIPPVPALHCAVVKEIAAEFREFHRFAVNPPAGVRFYAGEDGLPYSVTSETAADSILRHAVHGVNFPKVIHQAYTDGVRTFIEVGPGASLTRMLRDILAGKPYRVISLCPKANEELSSLYSGLAECFSLGFALDLSTLYPKVDQASVIAESKATLEVPVGGSRFKRVALPRGSKSDPAVLPTHTTQADSRAQAVSIPDKTHSISMVEEHPISSFIENVTRAYFAIETSTLKAHAEHLRIAQQTLAQTSRLLLQSSGSQTQEVESNQNAEAVPEFALRPTRLLPHEKPWLDYAQCHEYAVGKIGNVLGESFAPADAFPTRVRLPDGPLLLCHRIMAVDAVPLSMSHGTLITEHDVLEDAWYLDDGRIPVCIAVEAGQADLFLSGYLGIDFHTQGHAVYRLLDAVVTFHDRLPSPGEVIRYVIKIHGFFSQDATKLFRFSFEATVNGRRLITMENGVAGFFTQRELLAGKGVVKTALELKPMAGKITGGFKPLVEMTAASYSESQLDGLRCGDYAAAFGSQFSRLELASPKTLPGRANPMMRLVHRVLSLDPTGGRFGLGRIVGEADIHSDDWFLTCHFVDDKVMPGTLMFECCMHTLRIFLMRLGWVGEAADLSCEPIPGIASRLKCRGQVLTTSRKVQYQIDIKEIGYSPDAYALADALMFVDGKPIVEVGDMSVRHLGFTREKAEAVWAAAESPVDRKPALYTYDQILAFSNGKPSEAFGAPYQIFDGSQRKIARLPRPPFQFLDRVTETRAEPWKMVAGGTIEAQYDVPQDAWYFAAAGSSGRMPFAVLLEAALQPCGWFSAYMGSALTSDADLKYRNLGGTAVQHQEITPKTGTLTTTVQCTKVSHFGGMIIQNFTFAMTCQGQPVYSGETVFGFFNQEALAKQVGLRDMDPAWRQRKSVDGPALPYPDKPHLPSPPMLMVDRILELNRAGGRKGLGRIHGTKTVNPEEWFFAAHFFEDPVMPGSLGLEQFQQLLMVLADEYWPQAATAGILSPALGASHEWLYRGQVVPTNKLVEVCVDVDAIDEDTKTITASGVLLVDGLAIYEMKHFSVSVR